jgi:hypothetical protein
VFHIEVHNNLMQHHQEELTGDVAHERGSVAEIAEVWQEIPKVSYMNIGFSLDCGIFEKPGNVSHKFFCLEDTCV